jgi:hypothetical protein
MKDTEALDYLAEKMDKDVAVADALGVSAQTLSNWRARGQISADKRPAVWVLVNDHGGNLAREWLLGRAA